MTQLTLQESMTHDKRGGAPEHSTNNPEGGPSGSAAYNKTCPYCGEEGIGKLPYHLIECEAAQATGAVVDE
jgi:cytochrome c5